MSELRSLGLAWRWFFIFYCRHFLFTFSPLCMPSIMTVFDDWKTLFEGLALYWYVRNSARLLLWNNRFELLL